MDTIFMNLQENKSSYLQELCFICLKKLFWKENLNTFQNIKLNKTNKFKSDEPTLGKK